jgi:hypothetical protein
MPSSPRSNSDELSPRYERIAGSLAQSDLRPNDIYVSTRYGTLPVTNHLVSIQNAPWRTARRLLSDQAPSPHDAAPWRPRSKRDDRCKTRKPRSRGADTSRFRSISCPGLQSPTVALRRPSSYVDSIDNFSGIRTSLLTLAKATKPDVSFAKASGVAVESPATGRQR